MPLGIAAGALALTLIAFAVVESSAHAAPTGYKGTVNPNSKTVTLTGSGNVQISTSSGLLHHGNLGSGFASAVDFDSTKAGVQSVPDTGQWKVNISGGGSDTLEVDEGERSNPVSYTSGHTFYPNGTPCMVRDPNDHHGIVEFSVHPNQETEFCYPHGIGNVIVRGGTGSVQFGILDTQAGVPLHLYGSAHTANSIEEVAGVPTAVGGYHQAASPVYFIGGVKPAQIVFNDGVTKKPATYTIERGEIVKPGLPALHYSTTSTGSILILYPQAGPSKIEIKPTGGVATQIFGNFFGQKGPDTIDASHADAPSFITGSTGNDTVFASPAGGYVSGGGGSPTIHALNDFAMEIFCAPSGSKGTAYVTTMDSVKHCAIVHKSKPVVILQGVSFSPEQVAFGKNLTLRVPPYAHGMLKLTFQLGSKAEGTESKSVQGGTASVQLSPKAKTGGHSHELPRGKYRVAVQLSSGGRHSKTDHTTLIIH